MKALVLTEYNKFDYLDVPTPTPGTGEVLIKVKAARRCLIADSASRSCAWATGTTIRTPTRTNMVEKTFLKTRRFVTFCSPVHHWRPSNLRCRLRCSRH